MLLKERRPLSVGARVRVALKWVTRRQLIAAIAITLCVVPLIGGVMLYCVYLGAQMHRDHRIQGWEQTAHYVLESKLGIPLNYVTGLLASAPEHFALDIEHLPYQELVYARQQAFASTEQPEPLIPEMEYVRAQLTHDGQVYPVKVRLHGQYLDHVATEKWSLRIKARGGGAILGMERFNLMSPTTRYGVYEWVCHELSRAEGLIALRMGFVSLTINGRDMGVYVLEETFDKHLVEHNQRREGLIVRPTLPLRVHEEERALADPALTEQLALLKVLFDRFIEDDLPASELFDVAQMAKFYAITDLVNGFHGLIPNNMHLYFNPVTGLLEPIGREWDVHFYRGHSTVSGALSHEFADNYLHQRILGDPVVFRRYVAELERISEAKYLDAFFDSIDDALSANLGALYSDYPYYSFDKSYLVAGQRNISRYLGGDDIRAFYSGGEGDLTLRVSNRNVLPIEITGLSIDESRFELSDTSPILPAFVPNKAVVYQNLTVETGPIAEGAVVRVQWRVLGSSRSQDEAVLPWPVSDDEGMLDAPPRLPPNHNDFPFLHVDPVSRTIVIEPGQWTIAKTLVFPAGYVVTCDGAAELDLVQGAALLSYSPLQFRGSVAAPIVIHSSDDSGQGVTVLRAPTRSLLQGVRASDLAAPSFVGWTQPGAITFYESDVDIVDCVFADNRDGDDFVNLIRSEFSISNSRFRNVKADALDLDFCTGTIIDTAFVDCGNDAIDASGSYVEVRGGTLTRVGDKGLSAGESTRLTVSGMQIEEAEIAAACKDDSTLTLNDVEIRNSRVGLTAFVKKPVYGAATIQSTGIRMERVERPYLIERGSTATIDGKNIPATEVAVEGILYGVEFGKKSR